MTMNPKRMCQKANDGLRLLLYSCSLGWILVQSQAEVAYFLVAGRSTYYKDSYVLPMSKTENITEARRQLKELPIADRLIAIARITAGADGINRNHVVPGKPAWTWHVTEFIQFSEGGVELLDGSPSLVEQRITNWTDEKSG